MTPTTATRALRVSAELSLPLEVVTETFAILAKRGAGKTYTASVLVEELLEARLQVVVIDPMGAWYGLRSSADGKGAGYPIAILGGEHGDVPLEEAAGVVVADLVVDERLSVVLDLVAFSKSARRRFVADFLERLYHRNREALHVVLEEADLFAPEGQLRDPGDQRMLGAVYDLVRRGRGRGIGTTLVTQRSASISKEVLDQTEILIALRTTGPRDRKAIEGWINVHGVDEERKAVLDSLPSLPTGTAWVWWPVEGVLSQARIRERRTFDSSATPKPGEIRRAPKTVADVDLPALQARMAATIEKAKADDPRELRKRILELERQAAVKEKAYEGAARLEVREVETIVEVPVLNGQVDELREVLAGLQEFGKWMTTGAERIVSSAAGITAAIDRVQSAPRPAAQPPRRPDPASSAGRSTGAPAVVPSASDLVSPGYGGISAAGASTDAGEARALKAGARRMLSALAQLHPTPLTRGQIATLSDVSPAGGTFSDYLSAIRSNGLIVEDRNVIALSGAGQTLVAGELGRGAPTSDELLEMWGRKLKAGARRMLQVLHDAHPDGLSRADLAERAEVSAAGGTFSDYLSALRRNGMLDESQPGIVRAGEALFLGGRR